MTTWSGSLFSRRQFLGGMGAASAAIALPHLSPRSPVGHRPAIEPGILVGRTTAKPLPACFTDDFSREFAGSRLWRWETSSGVRVFGSTAFGRETLGGVKLDDRAVLRGRGMVVALEGSGDGAPTAGRMRTLDSFSFKAGRRYRLEFRVAGSHLRTAGGGLARSLEARVPGVGARTTVRLPCQAGFRPVRLEFTPSKTTTSPIEFAAGGAPGHGGLLLDSVQLTET
jgi:TAT (twin-arginine translocation) pathway signal sequence